MRTIRRGLFVALLSLTFLPRPSFAADITMIAQGTGSFIDTSWPGGLKCAVPIEMNFEVSGSHFVLTETEAVATPATNTSVDAAGQCAQWIFGGDAASDQIPSGLDCQSTPAGKVGVIPTGPYTFAGLGTTAKPYVIQYTAKCATETLTDKMTFTSATAGHAFSYIHDVISNGVIITHITATLTRMQ